MIYQTAYDTTIGKAFVMSKTVKAIQQSAIIDGNFDRTYGILSDESIDDTEMNLWFILGSVSSEAEIPFFSHPLVVQLQNNEKVLCVDVRPYASYNINHLNDDDAVRMKNRVAFNLEKLRLRLNVLWLEKRPTILREFSSIPMAIFSSWISENITRRFGLTPKDQMDIAIISCYYYYSLFSERNDLTEDEKVRLISTVMKTTRAPVSMVEEIFEKIEPMSSIKDFSKSIRTLVDNIRLENFDEGVLTNLVISSWFGVDAKQLISVALEHPPTWISLVYSAFTEKSFKNTAISKLAQRYLGSKGENDFVRSLINITNES